MGLPENHSDVTHLTCRLVSKEQEVQGLQAELEARTRELSEKMEQIHQQVRKRSFKEAMFAP